MELIKLQTLFGGLVVWFYWIYMYVFKTEKNTGPTKEKWRTNRDPIAANRGKSRQIAANRGKFSKFSKFHFKNNDNFFEKSRPISSQRAFQKTMAITLEVKFEVFLACTILVHAGHIFFPILGIGGVWVLVCIPPSLCDIFYQISLNLSQYF